MSYWVRPCEVCKYICRHSWRQYACTTGVEFLAVADSSQRCYRARAISRRLERGRELTPIGRFTVAVSQVGTVNKVRVSYRSAGAMENLTLGEMWQLEGT